ncbi:MAG: hypothetical protein Q7R62_00840 [bacterium]|nr:hypothetical protein [bacterium]
MITVTISKKEYQKLVDAKLRFEYLREIVQGNVFVAPPTKNSQTVLRAFTKTKKYNRRFLASLGKGLARSSYFR